MLRAEPSTTCLLDALEIQTNLRLKCPASVLRVGLSRTFRY